MKDSNESLEELIYSETEKRLEEMERPGYEFPERIGKTDVWIIIGSVLICSVLIALCMMGVIN